MSDAHTTLAQLKAIVADFEARRDWKQFHSPKNLAMGIAVETGELLEHFLWLDTEQSREVIHDPAVMADVRDEMADVFAYLLMLADALDIDLADAFCAKMERNEAKYPANQYHGRYKI